jgi:RNA polymerase sigma factor (sigma-70 family)
MPCTIEADLSTLNDARLASLARRGDAEALKELLRRHRGMVVRTADRFLAPGIERDDLIQAGMIALARAAAKWRPRHESGSRFSTYAFAAVLNDVRHERKSQDRQLVGLHQFAESDDDRDGLDGLPAPPKPDDEADQPGVFASLPDLERRIIEMRYGMQLTLKAVAASVGLTPLQVQRVQAAAVQRLRDRLPSR